MLGEDPVCEVEEGKPTFAGRRGDRSRRSRPGTHPAADSRADPSYVMFDLEGLPPQLDDHARSRFSTISNPSASQQTDRANPARVMKRREAQKRRRRRRRSHGRFSERSLAVRVAIIVVVVLIVLFILRFALSRLVSPGDPVDSTAQDEAASQAHPSCSESNDRSFAEAQALARKNQDIPEDLDAPEIVRSLGYRGCLSRASVVFEGAGASEDPVSETDGALADSLEWVVQSRTVRATPRYLN